MLDPHRPFKHDPLAPHMMPDCLTRTQAGLRQPLYYHPQSQEGVWLAEDIAVVDVISGGRFELGVRVGHKLEKFESFGVPLKERMARTNETLGIVADLSMARPSPSRTNSSTSPMSR